MGFKDWGRKETGKSKNKGVRIANTGAASQEIGEAGKLRY